MKRTIKEVYDLIKEKYESAIRYKAICKLTDDERLITIGEMNGYQDVLCLIESSGLLESESDK